MSSTSIKKKILTTFFFFSIFSMHQIYAASKSHFTPPPIPEVNTQSFKDYVKKFHSMPSPYGYEPYRDQQEKPRTFLLGELNTINPYIPVTLYCQSQVCPWAVIYTNDKIIFNYRDGEFAQLTVNQKNPTQAKPIIGFYFPNDPYYHVYPGYHPFNNVKKGEPLITFLLSQQVLQSLSNKENGQFAGFISVKAKNKSQEETPINLPLADGKENLSVGTTLSVIGMGEASGVEFTETVSQTTGETFSHQVQTGFTLNIMMQADAKIGGGIVPASGSLVSGVNAGLVSLVNNGLMIENQRTTTRTYTIKPGINDTYYWGLYQLMYSYRLNAPKLEAVFDRAQSIWDDMISFKIADNSLTQDGAGIGNLLPPQAANLPSDITVGVAVAMNQQANRAVYSKILTIQP